MSLLDQDQQQFVDKARKLYDEKLKDQLEKEHFGKVIAVDPESGDYVLGDTFLAAGQACQNRFGNRPVYYFRVGGGGAVRFAGSRKRGRAPG